MIKLLGVLLSMCVLFVGGVHAADVNLCWDVPADNTDGSVFLPEEIGWYRLYSSRVSGAYDGSINVGNVTNYTLTGLDAGYWYFVATCVNVISNESDKSDELMWRTPSLPVAPTVISDSKINRITLDWSEIRMCMDGQSLLDTDRFGYRVFQGTSQLDLVPIGLTTELTYQITGLSKPTWFAVSTVGTNLVPHESEMSNVIVWNPKVPNKPRNVRESGTVFIISNL